MPDSEQKPGPVWPSTDYDTAPDDEQSIGERDTSEVEAPEHPTVRVQIPPSIRIPAGPAVPRQPQPPPQATAQTQPLAQPPPQLSDQPQKQAQPQGQAQLQEQPQSQAQAQLQGEDQAQGEAQEQLQSGPESAPDAPELEPASGIPEPENTEAPRPSRGRRGLLIAAFALVLTVAVGVTVALPDVSNRLALPWAPNAPQSPPPEPLTVTRDLHGPAVSAEPPAPSGVAAALDEPASDPALGDLAGSVIDPATGNVLWERGGNRAPTPASTTKLLTAGAALLVLDPDTQLSTTVVQGEQPGTVILVAGGDVTLSSLAPEQESIYPGAASLDTLVEQVREATGGDVQQVRIDLTTFTGGSTAPGWAPEDVPAFTAAVVPAMLDGGHSIATDPLSDRVDDPAGVLVREFAERLGAEAGPPLETPVSAGARTLGEVQSAPLTELINQMLLASDNVLSEALARQVALAEGAEPSFEGAARATLDVLSRNGFETSGITLFDGSGLSPMNEVSADVLAELLSVAAAPSEDDDPRAEALRPLLEGLPVAAGHGTLAERYTTGPASAGQGWVRAKTGTLAGVHTLAGVVLDSDDRVLVFAFMSSGSDQGPARAALDRLAAALRGCGCR